MALHKLDPADLPSLGLISQHNLPHSCSCEGTTGGFAETDLGLVLAVSSFPRCIPPPQPLLGWLLPSFWNEFWENPFRSPTCVQSLLYVFPNPLHISPITASPALSLIGHHWHWDRALHYFAVSPVANTSGTQKPKTIFVKLSIQ